MLAYNFKAFKSMDFNKTGYEHSVQHSSEYIAWVFDLRSKVKVTKVKL